MPEPTTDLTFASCMSQSPDPDRVLEEVVSALRDRLPSTADFFLLFGTAKHRTLLERVAAEVERSFSPRMILGCTGQGVIGVRREVEADPGFSVIGGALPGARFETFTYDQVDWPAVIKSPDSLRRTLGIHAGVDEVRGMILLADPFSTPMTRLLPAMDEALPGVPIIGGMASAADQPGENRLLLDGDVRLQGAVGVAISGEVDIQTTVSQGCRPVGKPVVITKAQRNVVQELGGHNALLMIRHMVSQLDAEDQALVENGGLLVGRVIDEYRGRFGRGDFLIRALVGVDPENGFIAIGDPQVRVGQTVQFHVRDAEIAANDFRLLLEAQRNHGPGAGALLISCNGRGAALHGRAHGDATLVHEALGDVPMAGFFAAGEIGPIAGRTFLHGHAASLLVFRPYRDDPSLV